MKCNETCLIVSGGSVDLAFLKEYLSQNQFDMMIAADRGLLAFWQLSLCPTHLVGDFDSIDKNVLEEYKNDKKIMVEQLIPEKDDTDTEHALNMAIHAGCKHIVLMGATGTRLDHTLANIHILYKGLENGVHVELLDCHNRIYLIHGETAYKKEELFGPFVSLFPFTGEVKGITIKGFKYPLNNKNLSTQNCFGLCVSNELIESVGTIQIRDGIMICMETRD